MPEIHGLVLEALEKAVQQDGELRLLAQGKTKAGLLSGTRSKAGLAAMKQCLDSDLSLFNVREEKEGKAQKPAHFVKITRRGIEALFENLQAPRRRALVGKVASSHQEVVREICLSQTGRDFAAIQADMDQLLNRKAEIFGSLRSMIQAEVAGLRAQEAHLRQLLENSSNLLEELSERRSSLGELGPIPEPRRKPQSVVGASSDEDLDFQRDVCEELVYAWQDATQPEVREALDRVMMNNGLEPVGQTGEVVPFDGLEHHTEDPVLAGEPVTVAAQGWRLVNRRGSYLIARARVTMTQPSTQEATHVSNDQH